MVYNGNVPIAAAAAVVMYKARHGTAIAVDRECVARSFVGIID